MEIAEQEGQSQLEHGTESTIYGGSFWPVLANMHCRELTAMALLEPLALCVRSLQFSLHIIPCLLNIECFFIQLNILIYTCLRNYQGRGGEILNPAARLGGTQRRSQYCNASI